MKKTPLFIVGLLIVIGAVYCFAVFKKPQLLEPKELESALNQQLQMMADEMSVSLEGHLTCDLELTCSSKRIVLGDIENGSILYFNNVVVKFRDLQEYSVKNEISADVSFTDTFLEQFEQINPGVLERFMPIFPSHLMCTVDSSLRDGIHSSLNDCSFNAPSVDFAFRVDMDLAMDAYKNVTMPDLVMNGDFAFANEDSLMQSADSFRLGMRELTIDLNSRKLGDVLFEITKIDNPDMSRSEFDSSLTQGMNMGIAMGIAMLRNAEMSDDDVQITEEIASALEKLQSGVVALLAQNPTATKLRVSLTSKEQANNQHYSIPMLETSGGYEVLRNYNIIVDYQ